MNMKEINIRIYFLLKSNKNHMYKINNIYQGQNINNMFLRRAAFLKIVKEMERKMMFLCIFWKSKKNITAKRPIT